MSNKKFTWLLILFVLIPISYIYTFISLLSISSGGKPIHYLILALCCAVIISVNVFIIKNIDKE